MQFSERDNVGAVAKKIAQLGPALCSRNELPVSLDLLARWLDVVKKSRENKNKQNFKYKNSNLQEIDSRMKGWDQAEESQNLGNPRLKPSDLSQLLSSPLSV